MKTSIAFEKMGDDTWIAGQVYLRNLFQAVKQLKSDEIRLCLLATPGDTFSDDYVSSLEPDTVVRFDPPRRWSGWWLLNGVSKRLRLTDKVLGRVLNNNSVNALFGPSTLFRYPGVATLTWLPDFQHVRLPEMFSDEERIDRDKVFMQSIIASNRVILLSEAVKKDFETFAPKYARKGRTIAPITYLPRSTYDCNPLSVVDCYNLPEKFVYIPNQFWRHKNHLTAIEAVRILREKGVKVTLVCTGYPGDFRHAGYFASLWEKVSQWNLREQVIYLGLVPRQHVVQLIRQSVCVLSPSLFEGWGLGVDEARSVGKRLLASDIPAHREQNSPEAIFFDPRNCEDLSEKLARLWAEGKAGPDPDLEGRAREELPARVRATAQRFVALCREACDEVAR